MESEVATNNELLTNTCQCAIEIDPQGVIHRSHESDCEYGKLLEDRERLSRMAAGMSTAALGYLRPDEAYAGKPIAQIEEVIILREAFRLASAALVCYEGKAQTTNSVMVHYLEQSRINCGVAGQP